MEYKKNTSCRLSPINRVSAVNPRLSGSEEENRIIRELHKQLFIVDMHADSLLWNRDLLKRSKAGHVDVPRLISGNVALQVFSMVTETPLYMLKSHASVKRGYDMLTLLHMLQRRPMKTWRSPQQRALFMANKFHYFSAVSKDRLFFIFHG